MAQGQETRAWCRIPGVGRAWGGAQGAGRGTGGGAGVGGARGGALEARAGQGRVPGRRWGPDGDARSRDGGEPASGQCPHP